MADPSKIAAPAPGSKRLVKVLVLLGLAGVLGFLFMRSVRGTRAEPYAIPPRSLEGWTLAFQAPTSTNDAGFVLHVPAELTRAVFDQVFKRTMESMNMSGTPSVPLLTQRELDGPLAGRLTPEAITAIARDSGLLAPFVPRCLAHRRVSEPTSTQQLYFMLFDAPAFTRFRDAIAARNRRADHRRSLAGEPQDHQPDDDRGGGLAALASRCLPVWDHRGAQPIRRCRPGST